MSDALLTKLLPGAAYDEVRHAIRVANQPAALALRQPILFVGEPGVGKNHSAHVAAAHRQWLGQPEIARDLYLRDNKWQALTTASFREVLLTTLPEALVESELFGFVKGAFTNALHDHEGIFGSETVTDVLLDEIGDVSLTVQPKLLQIIQSGVYRRVGSKLSERRETSTRVLLATNQDLPQLVASGRFREDLFWRVSQIVARIPPIRDHRADIPSLLENVRRSIVSQIGENNVHAARALERRVFADQDVAWATQYAWPGNIREIERLVRLWLLAPTLSALADVYQQFPLPSPHVQAVDADATLRAAVQRWVEEMRNGRRPSPGTVGAVLAEMNKVLRAAWADLDLTTDDLKALFPSQAITNVRSRLSRYGKRRRKE